MRNYSPPRGIVCVESLRTSWRREFALAGISRALFLFFFSFLSFFSPTRYTRLSMISFHDTCLVHDRTNFRPVRRAYDAIWSMPPPGRVITRLRRVMQLTATRLRQWERCQGRCTNELSAQHRRGSEGARRLNVAGSGISPMRTYTHYLRANLYDVTDVFPSAIPSPRAILFTIRYYENKYILQISIHTQLKFNPLFTYSFDLLYLHARERIFRVIHDSDILH